jgi:mannose/cellobiose epimerase-like protein (N-acyl-D-glucosamine 2-epimerase family)
MARRDFLALAAVASASPLAGATGRISSSVPPVGDAPPALKLAGMSLPELRARYHSYFFGTYLPFWDQHGIDHEYGGFMCAFDHDGTRVNTNKFHWFQARGIWVYSFLYNYFKPDPHYLEIAKKTKDFMLAHFPQKDGFYAELVTREGKVLKPFSGDIFGMYFAAEGLQEYAYAAKDDEARALAFGLMKKLFAYMNQPGVTDPETGGVGVRSQGVWMVILRNATQMLRRWNDPEIASMAQQCVDYVIHKHYNPEFGLTTETLNFDFSRPKETANVTVLGHSVETLWMIMDEALRRKDQALYDLCVERVRHNLEVGWDYIYGGLADSVNVDQGCYQWPVDNPVGTELEFHATGEYKWVKTAWAVDEVLLATMNVIEHKRHEWAVTFFDRAHEMFEQKFSLQRRGYALFQIFGDRRVTFQPHSTRQENYHHARQIMLNLLAMDRMIGKGHA